jgi:hypothetical protein
MISQLLALAEAEFSGVTNAPDFFFGDQYLPVHHSPPRVVWAVRDETTGPGRMISETNATDHDAIMTRHTAIEAYVWGASFSQAEAIVHCLCTVWRDLTRGCGGVQAIRWPSEGETGWVAAGTGAVVVLGVDVPVMDVMCAIPDAPDPALNADAGTVVTWVAGTPAANEANLSRGTIDFDHDSTD